MTKISNPTALLRKFLLPIILVSGFALFFASGAHRYISFAALAESYADIKLFVSERWLLSLTLYFVIYFTAVALSLPIASVLTLAGGAILGWTAALIILLAATSGAFVVFFAARNLLHDWLKEKAGPFMLKLEDGFQKNGFFYLLALRLIPAAPFWVVNIVPACVGMSAWPFIIATFFGIAPGSLIYVWVAQGFDHVLSQGDTPDLSLLAEPQIILPLAALGVMALLPVLFQKIKQHSNPSSKEI